MKKLVFAVAVLVAAYFGLGQIEGVRQLTGSQPAQSPAAEAGLSGGLRTAIAEQRSGTQVTGEGVVTKLLSDDTEGSRHQRFILTLASGQTLLVAHNIDLAPRIDLLKVGDSVSFNGVYEPNAKGGSSTGRIVTRAAAIKPVGSSTPGKHISRAADDA